MILVTTKKGAKGQPAQVTYDAYYGIQEPWKKIGLLNAEQYAILMNESRASAGLVPYSQLADPAALGEGTDWQDALFQRAPIMNHSFNFTKGTATSSTAIGGSHFVQDGIIGGEKGRFERTTFRISSQQEAGDRFRIGQTVNFTHLNRNALAENNEFATPVVRIEHGLRHPGHPPRRILRLLRVHRQRHRQPDQPGGNHPRHLDHQPLRRQPLRRVRHLAEPQGAFLHERRPLPRFPEDLLPPFDLGIGPNDPTAPPTSGARSTA